MLWSELSAFKSLPAGAGRPPERAVGRLYHRSERLSFASFGGVAETLLFVAPGPSCESRRDSPRVLCEGPALLTLPLEFSPFNVAPRTWARVVHGIKPNSLPNCTACVRRFAPSLSKTRLEWVFTVFSRTNSRAAISRLLNPPE